MADEKKPRLEFPDPKTLRYKVWAMRRDTYVFDFGGAVCMYLLVGSERALLIDTAYGYGDLPGMIRELTPLPVVVVNTHAHGDHTGGDGFFPEVHLYRPPFFLEPIGVARPASDFPHPRFRKVAVQDGHVFALGGGRDVEVLAIPAHNDSSVALLDRRERLLFTGDELEAGQVLMFEDGLAQVGRHRANMEKLWARRGEFDALCPSHNGTPVEPGLILDFLRLGEEILAGHPQLVDDPLFPDLLVEMKGVLVQGLRARHGRASIVYAVPRAFEPGFEGHALAASISDALAKGLMSLDATGGFCPDKPVGAADLARAVNALAHRFHGKPLEVPSGAVGDLPIRREDAYIAAALALGLEGALGWPSRMPAGPGGAACDLRRNATAALQRYDAAVYGQDPAGWLTRADAAHLASRLVYKADMLEAFEPRVFEKDGEVLPYRLYRPATLVPGRKYPLVLFLHGGGEQGTDNVFQLTANDGASVWVDRARKCEQPDCFVLAPQAVPAPGRMGWDNARCRLVDALLGTVLAENPVDPRALCCTGMSMGGLGTWTMNRLFPDRFACMVGICGVWAFDRHGLDELAAEVVRKLKAKPIWIFHAEDDVVVDVDLTRRAAELFREAGSNLRYTEYPASAGYNHGSWVPAYADREMRDWVFRQFPG